MSKNTYEHCLQIAKLYNYQKDFRIGHRGVYQTAWKKGWLDDICSHMIYLKEEWTFEKVKESALKYKNTRDWISGDHKAEATARFQGWVSLVTGHFEKLKDSKRSKIEILKILKDDLENGTLNFQPSLFEKRLHAYCAPSGPCYDEDFKKEYRILIKLWRALRKRTKEEIND